MRVRVAIVLGLVLVIGLLVVTLSQSKQRLSSSNAQVVVSGADVPIPGRSQACQPEGIAGDTSALRVFVGTEARLAGPLGVSIRRGDRTISRGSFGFVTNGAPARAELTPPIRTETTPVEVCFRNRGRAEIRLAGDRTPLRGGANPAGFIFDDEPRVDYLRSGSESWWDIAGLVSDRFGRGKTTFFGSWTMWAVFALVGVTWAIGIALLLRREPAG
jgi:hypothetical protein